MFVEAVVSATGAVLLQHGAILAQQALSGLRQDPVRSQTTTRLPDTVFDRVGITGFDVVLLACLSLGGALHAVGMSVRKHIGSGHSPSESLAQWKWWVGALIDAAGGVLIWPAMPYISVNIIMPWVVVAQLGVTYFVGCLYFKEAASALSHTGLALAVCGVIGISVTNPLHAADFSMEGYWTLWIQTPFLIASGICNIALIGAFFCAHRSTFWALAAAALEAVQFISTRAVIDTAITGKLSQSGSVGATVTKCLCIVGILLFQHWGLQSHLSQFSGIFLSAGTLLICILGTMFFGEAVVLSRAFLISAVAACTGIWLLNLEQPHKLDET